MRTKMRDGVRVPLTPDEEAERDAAAAADVEAQFASTIYAVKAEAGRRILAIAPEWKQRNLTARAAELLRKGEGNWTAEEQAEVSKMDGLWDRVKALRAASDTHETAVAAMTPAELAAFEPMEDILWPE